MNKFILGTALFFLSFYSYGGGWTSAAMVEHIEIIRSQGFQIKGAFGNPSQCTVANYVFVAINHPQYDQLLATATAAFLAGKQLKIYSHTCTTYGWHGGSYNELTGDGSMYLQ